MGLQDPKGVTRDIGRDLSALVVSSVREVRRLMPGKSVNDLTDLTVQGIWEAHLKGGLAEADAVDRAAVRAAGVLAQKGHWTWMFQAATEDLTSWQDLNWNYWIVDPGNGCIWEWGTM